METLDSCVYGINIKIYYFTVSNSVQSVYISVYNHKYICDNL